MSNNRLFRRLKRTFALLLVLCMIAGMTTTVYAEPSDSDLTEYADYYEEEPAEEADEFADYDAEEPIEDDAEEPAEEDTDELAGYDAEEPAEEDAEDSFEVYSDEQECTIICEMPEGYYDSSMEDGNDSFMGNEPGSDAPPIQNNYNLKAKDGNYNINYYLANKGNNDIPLTDNQLDFYRDILLGNYGNVPEYNKYKYDYDTIMWMCPAYYWRKISGVILRQAWGHGFNYNYLSDRMIDAISGDPNALNLEYTTDWRVHPIRIQEQSILNNSMSLKAAESTMLSYLKDNPQSLGYGFNSTDAEWTKTQPVLWYAVWGHEENYKAEYLQSVVFSDFKVKPLLPDAKGGNYVSKRVDTVESDETYAANWTNETLRTTNGSKVFEENNTTEISSTINGSKGYEFSEALTIGAEYGFGASKVAMSAAFTSTQSVQKGWEEGTAYGDSKLNQHTISTDLEPYTGVIMRQTKGVSTITTEYNCPVAVTFKVRVLWYKTCYPHGKWDGWDKRMWTFGGDEYGEDARASLHRRAIVDKHSHVDPNGVDWSGIGGFPAEVINIASTSVPVAKSGGTFVEVVNTVNNKVEGLKPLKPLKGVVMTKQANKIGLLPGGTFRVDDIELEGISYLDGNSGATVPYFGFDSGCGEWYLADNQGRPITDETIAKLTTDEATGWTELEAVAPGTVYLRYRIDEDCYDTFTDPTYAKNSDLTLSPRIEVTIDNVHVNSVDLNMYEIELTEGQSKGGLGATVKPDDASEKRVTWETEDPEIATVTAGNNNRATVKGVSAGRTTVTAKTVDGNKQAVADVIVRYAKPAARQSDDRNRLIGLVADGVYEINGVEYTADSSGTIPVQPKWYGRTITITRINKRDSDLNSPIQQTLSLDEEWVYVEDVTLDKTEITVTEDKTAYLNATVAPKEADDKSVTWKSADEGIATATGTTSRGTVKGIAAGRTKVTVTTVDSEKTATADVIVRYATPQAVQEKDKLTGLVANGEYLINKTKITADESGSIAVNQKWYNKEISIIRAHKKDSKLNSDEQKLLIQGDLVPVLMKKVSISGFKSTMPYTGEAVEQNAVLKYGSGKNAYTLEEGVDYRVIHLDNYDIGTARVIYQAIENNPGSGCEYLFTGSVEKTFKINGKYILHTEGAEENCTITLEAEEYPYANADIKPNVTVTAQLVNNSGIVIDRQLTPGKDFAVTYKNNKAVADADATKKGKDVAPQVIVKGKGNYEFSDTVDMKKGVVKRFAIARRDLSDLVLTTSDVVYNKTAGKYKSTKIQFFDNSYRDMKLAVKKDYTAKFATSDNTEAPQAGSTVTVTITAAKDSDGNYSGNYEGEVTATYRIVDNKANTDIAKAKVVVNPNAKGLAQPCDYTGNAIEPGKEGHPGLKVTIGTGKNERALTDEEYEIVGYYNNTAVGSNAVILMRGKGSFYGIRAIKFKIK